MIPSAENVLRIRAWHGGEDASDMGFEPLRSAAGDPGCYREWIGVLLATIDAEARKMEDMSAAHSHNVVKLQARLALAEEALRQAVSVIESWHGPEAWDIYQQHAPEMQAIRDYYLDSANAQGGD